MNLHVTCHLLSGSVVTFVIATSDSLQFTSEALTDTSNVTQASKLSMTEELFVLISLPFLIPFVMSFHAMA
jgi:hypothetical protein